MAANGWAVTSTLLARRTVSADTRCAPGLADTIPASAVWADRPAVRAAGCALDAEADVAVSDKVSNPVRIARPTAGSGSRAMDPPARRRRSPMETSDPV
jgi:hypothetical protein